MERESRRLRRHADHLRKSARIPCIQIGHTLRIKTSWNTGPQTWKMTAARYERIPDSSFCQHAPTPCTAAIRPAPWGCSRDHNRGLEVYYDAQLEEPDDVLSCSCSRGGVGPDPEPEPKPEPPESEEASPAPVPEPLPLRLVLLPATFAWRAEMMAFNLRVCSSS